MIYLGGLRASQFVRPKLPCAQSIGLRERATDSNHGFESPWGFEPVSPGPSYAFYECPEGHGS